MMPKRGTRKRRLLRRPTRPGAVLHNLQHDHEILKGRLAEVETRVTRNRADLEIQLRRIAELQAEMDQLGGRTKA